MNSWNSNQCASAGRRRSSRMNSRLSGGAKTKCNTDDRSACDNVVGSSDEATLLSSGSGNPPGCRISPHGQRAKPRPSWPKLDPQRLLVTSDDMSCRINLAPGLSDQRRIAGRFACQRLAARGSLPRRQACSTAAWEHDVASCDATGPHRSGASPPRRADDESAARAPRSFVL